MNMDNFEENVGIYQTKPDSLCFELAVNQMVGKPFVDRSTSLLL